MSSYWTKDTFVEDLAEIVSIDSRSNALGINKKPTCAFDVNGDVKANNIIVSNNLDASNITASNNIEGNDINILSNLRINGFSLYDECPLDTNDWNNLIPFKADAGFIHESWIRKPLSAVDILKDLYDLADLGVDIGQAIWDLYSFMQGDLTQQALLQALQSALEQGLSASNSNQLFVSYNNLKNRPFATNGYNFGVGGDLYIDSSKCIKVLDTGNFSTQTMLDNLTLLNTNQAETIFDFSTRQAFLSEIQLSNNDTAIYLPNQIINNNQNFEFGNFEGLYIDWSSNINSNVGTSNSAFIFNRNSNIYINDTKIYKDGSKRKIEADQILSSSYCDKENPLTGLSFLSFQSYMSFVNQYARGFYSKSNPQDWSYSWLFLEPMSMSFKTRDVFDSNLGVFPAIKTLLKVDSNGTFVNSNIYTNNSFSIRASKNATIDEPAKDGLLILEPENLTFKQRIYTGIGNCNNEYINASINSNGMFLLQRNAILGKIEAIEKLDLNTMSNYYEYDFARLESTLSNGLQWGKGIGLNNNLTDRTYFQFTRKGELYTYCSSNDTLSMLVNSNAEIQKGGLTIDNTGILSMSNKPFLLPEGSIVRRPHLDSNYGFKVSPSGYLTVGELQINPGGELNTKSNIIGSNIHASNFKEGVSNLINKYALSNTLSNVLNKVEWSSNAHSNNTIFSFSNWATPKIEWTSNMMSNVDILINDIQDDIIWNSNALSNYRPKSTQITWNEIQNKPNINFDSNGGVDALSVAGMTLGGAGLLGAAGLWFGQQQLFSQTGKLTGVIGDLATGGLKLSVDPSGHIFAETASFNDLSISNKMNLDGTTGLIDAFSGQFRYCRMTQGIDVGLMTMSLSNDQIFWKNSNNSNTIMSSNGIRVYNSNSFAFSNSTSCNWNFYGGIKIGNLTISQNGEIYSGCNLLIDSTGQINSQRISWSGLCNVIPSESVNYNTPEEIQSYNTTLLTGADVFNY